MLVHIFLINISSIALKDLYDFKNLLPQIRLDKINKFRFEQDKIRCFLSHLLPLVALSYVKKQPSFKTSIYNNSNGKPFFKGSNNPFFNTSHSGDWVVCAISDQPVGIDVEAVTDINISLFSPYLSFFEQQLFTNQNDDLLLFYRLWTLKESLLKTTGYGLTYPLENLCFSEYIKGNLNFYIFENKKYSFKEFYKENHQFCVCVRDTDIEYKIVEIKLNDLLSYRKFINKI